MKTSSPTLPGCLLSRLGILPLLLALGACGTYVEPKPGVHRNVGEPGPERLCEYAAPTAMRITSWTCRQTDQMAAEEGVAKETLERMRVFQPRDP
jgi:hypothetical protein